MAAGNDGLTLFSSLTKIEENKQEIATIEMST